jgi:hypothetical protein
LQKIILFSACAGRLSFPPSVNSSFLVRVSVPVAAYVFIFNIPFMQKIFSLLRKRMLVSAIIIAISIIASCNKKAESVTPALPGNEFLTTVQLRLVNAADPTEIHTGSWSQMSPTNHTYQPDSAYFNNAYLNLKANATYHCSVIILDSTQTPVDSVSNEILQRENYHLFFFQPSPILASNVVISNTTTYIPTADWITNDNTDTTAGGISINEMAIPPSTLSPLNLVVNRTDMDDNAPPMQIGLQDDFITGAASTGTLRVVLRHQPNAKNGTYPPGSSDLDVTYAITIQ